MKFSASVKSYSVHKIGSHAVAVAQVQGVLPQYVQWHRQNKFGSNKTRRVLGEVNQRFIGRKPNKPRRSRKNKENHEHATDVADNTTTVDVCSKAGLHDNDMYVRKLSGTRIVKCHGCRAKIREIPAVPPAPNDIVLAAKTFVALFNPRTCKQQIKRDLFTSMCRENVCRIMWRTESCTFAAICHCCHVISLF